MQALVDVEMDDTQLIKSITAESMYSSVTDIQTKLTNWIAMHDKDYYFDPDRWAKYCNQHMSVCLSVRLSVSVSLSVCPLAHLKNHTSKFHQIFRTCDMCPWLLWRHCSMLRTSVFVDDAMLSHNEANGPESNTSCIFRPVRQVAVPGAKSVVSDCILFYTGSLMLSLFCAFYKIYRKRAAVPCANDMPHYNSLLVKPQHKHFLISNLLN